MAPKVSRKASISGRDLSAGASKATQNVSMPPPPDPVPPKGILESEVDALGGCLRSMVVKTGQVYGFYADVRRLGIQQYTSRPPRSLTASLGREIEKYDQLCDAIESQLNRAIAVLQRDIGREEQRLRAEAEAAAAAAKATVEAEAAATSSTPTVSPTSSSPPNTLIGIRMDMSSDTSSSRAPLSTPVRRQSTVSLSSLQRPNFQHKLDLSSASMRINPDELLSGIPSVLSSPVTLAPKSSHRAIPQELVMAALTEAASRPVDIDLTVSDPEMDMPHVAGAAAPLDPTAGTSADKPIELDMDMDMDVDIFDAAASAATQEASQQMFNPGDQSSDSSTSVQPGGAVNQEDDFFSGALNAAGASGDMGDILASLGNTAGHSHSGNAGDQPHIQQPTLTKTSSPASILATFDAASAQPTEATASHETQFDLNSIVLSGFQSLDEASMFGDHPAESDISMSEVENLFNIDMPRGEHKETATS